MFSPTKIDAENKKMISQINISKNSNSTNKNK